MPIRASVESLPEPGYAILRISDLDAAPEGLAISIQRQQGPDSHLADDGWRRTEAWLLPERVERKRDAMEFHLGPEICDRLAGIATVRLRVQEPDIGVIATTVIAWPSMLTSGAARSVEPALRRHGASAPRRSASAGARARTGAGAGTAAAPLPPPRPELRASRALDPGPPRRSGAAGWLIAALVLVAIAGGGYYAYTTYFHKEAEPAVAAAPSATPATAPAPVPNTGAARKSVRETVDEYLATKPTPEAMLAKARDYAKADDMAAAFLVFRRAAETGNPAAQLELATFYDPLTTPARGGFARRRRARRRLV